jgi:hypothetical protein
MLKRWLGVIATAVLLAPLGASIPAQASPVQSREIKTCGAPGTPTSSCVENGPPEFVPSAMMKSAAGIKAPKGNPFLKTAKASTKGTNARLPLSCSSPSFFYGGTNQVLGGTDYTSGAAANLHIYQTYLAPADCHTLSELIVQSSTSSFDAVEVGATVDSGVCGAQPTPCLFVFWWDSGVPQCYNGCSFTPYAPTCSVAANYCAGESVLALAGSTGPTAQGNPYRFTIVYSGGAWWVAFNGLWIGTYSGALWASPTFTQAKVVQGFYELAAAGPTSTPCSDLGNGFPSSSTSAARVGTVALQGPNSPAGLTVNMVATGTSSPYPAPNVLSTATSRQGGPGTGGVKDGC